MQTPEEFSTNYFNTLKNAIDKIDPEKVRQAVEMIYHAYKNGKQVFILGNGGSASTASHFACDLGKLTVNDFSDAQEKRFKVVSLADSTSIMTALGNDISYEDVFWQQLANLVSKDDVVVGISTSGNSPNVVRAVKKAKERGAKTIGLLGFSGGGVLHDLVDLEITIQNNHCGQVEDVHLILTHIMAYYLSEFKKEGFRTVSLDGKIILVTGGAGSFGQKFVQVALKDHNPKSIRVYDNRELALVEMERKFNDSRLRFFLGDVRDKNRLKRAMDGADIVIHAAALKHVPVCEYNPLEAIKTNIDGAINVIDAAMDSQVKKVINISTDKAVQPANLYGATKMVAEKLFIQANSYSVGKTALSCSRYGNVVGSSGSIIPLIKEQKNNGEVTITDERMTRFWITLEDGVEFVIRCIENMKGGEIFVPKIPSMKIMDLAEALAPDCAKKIIGIRPGEKLHEVLLTEEECRHAKEFENYYVIQPEFAFWDGNNHKDGKEMPTNFCYSSDKNSSWLDKNKIQEI